MAEIILTADCTLMSNYHENEFLGFGTCAPPNFIPEWLFRFLFFPPLKEDKGLTSAAPYGLRKIEAQLLKVGFNVITVNPDHIEEHIDEAKALGIYVMDPFGLGPASSTLATILKNEPYLARYFQILVGKSAIRQARKRGMKIIVGGPGAWQFHYRKEFVKEYSIDCIVNGEAEAVIGSIFRAAIHGAKLPKFYEVSIKETPSLDKIPDIVNPSINGLIEIGRGCCRGCEFCSVTQKPLRWYPFDKIHREMEVNIKSGKVNGCCLHAEDVMLYGSRNTIPVEKKLVRVHELAMNKINGGFSWSHCSLAAVASRPKIFSRIAEMIIQKQGWWGAEIGIETGSPELAKKIMPSKAHPFKAEEWNQVVRVGMGLMNDNNLVPAATLIVGIPGEREEDIIKTMELLDDLRSFRSLIVPLFFVPLGRMRRKDWFRRAEMSELHKQLLLQCTEHDFHWVDNLLKIAFKGKWYERVLREFYKAFVGIAKRKVRQLESKLFLNN